MCLLNWGFLQQCDGAHIWWRFRRTLQPGTSATLAINLASVNEFNGTAR
jgi:hypothetical protein